MDDSVVELKYTSRMAEWFRDKLETAGRKPRWNEEHAVDATKVNQHQHASLTF